MTLACGAVRQSLRSRRTATVLFATLAFAGSLAASAASAQTITVSGNPSTMTVSTAVAGSAPTLVTNATTTYHVTTAAGGVKRITAKLSAALPPGVTLTITVAAPTGAVSSGAVTLTTTAQSVVTSINNNTNQNNLTITYRLTATAAAGVVTVNTKTVTFTVTT